MQHCAGFISAESLYMFRAQAPIIINIRIKGINQQCQNTLRTANLYRINQEIKFLYAKKSKLNEKLLQLHLSSSGPNKEM